MTVALPSKVLEQAQKLAQREGIAVDELITAADEPMRTIRLRSPRRVEERKDIHGS